MKIFNEIKDGRKDYRSRKNIKSKVKFQKDGFYKCLGLKAWVRYSKFEFRLEEIYYFLGLRELIYDLQNYESMPFDKIINKMIPLIKKDFEEILIDAQQFYNTYENFKRYNDWSCGI